MGNDRIEERYQAFIRNSSEGIWLCEVDTPIPIDMDPAEQIKMMYRVGWMAEANDAMAKMYAMPSKDALVGMRLNQMLVEDDPQNTEYLTAFIESGYNLQGAESHEIDQDGNMKVFRNSLVGVIEDGCLQRAWGTQQDVTGQVLATERLQKSEERLALALQVSKMGLWEWDILTNKLTWSDELKALFGMKPSDDIDYEKYVSMLHPEDQAHIKQIVQKSMKTGEEYSVDHRVIWPDKTVHWITGYGKAYLKNGKPVRMIGTSVSIEDVRRTTELEALNKDLQEQREELRKLNQSKDEFISLASHQLRTPATAVKQYIGLILEGYKGKVKENQLDALQKAYASNERQLGIINDLLRVAQLDAGKVTLHREKINMVPVLKKIIADMDARLKGKNQTAVFRSSKPKVVIPIDIDRMLMALDNIIDNAIKYSPESTTITVEIKSRKSEVDIKITDQGIGIRKRDIPRLFQKFSRLEDPIMSEVSGNGLGLYWANKIILLHGGRLEIESTRKKGSTFIITLPKQIKEKIRS